MTNIEAYLDESCHRLSVNPAEADDIREELRSHLQELIAEYVAEGLDRRTAIDRALLWFGDARSLRDSFHRVHSGDPWWVRRLKGLVLGSLLGVFISLLLPLGGHLEFATRLLCSPAEWDPMRTQLAANGLIAGGLIGLLAAGGRAVLAGWTFGSVVWLAEYVVYWIGSVTGGALNPRGDMLNSVLLAPLFGGVFGVIVGAGTAAILSAGSRIRPQIQ